MIPIPGPGDAVVWLLGFLGVPSVVGVIFTSIGALNGWFRLGARSVAAGRGIRDAISRSGSMGPWLVGYYVAGAATIWLLYVTAHLCVQNFTTGMAGLSGGVEFSTYWAAALSPTLMPDFDFWLVVVSAAVVAVSPLPSKQLDGVKILTTIVGGIIAVLAGLLSFGGFFVFLIGFLGSPEGALLTGSWLVATTGLLFGVLGLIALQKRIDDLFVDRSGETRVTNI